jgi:hypothetical protein
MKITVLAAALASSMMLAGTAQAANYGTLNASYDGVMPGLSNGVNGGVFNFTKLGGTFTTPLLTNTPANDFIGFCLDLGEFVASPVLYQVQDLTDAPVPGVKITAQKATDLAKLVGGVLAGSFSNVATTLDTNLKASAFQLAVWEIVNEGGGTYDTTAGWVYAPSDGTVRTLANTYLGTIAGATAASGLFALTSAGTQDFMVQVVPIPAAAWLLGSGLLGLFGLARRKKAAAAA